MIPRPCSPAVLLCLLVSLSSCTTLRPDFEQPRVTVSSFRPVFTTAGVPNFEIGLRVVNPNNFPLELQGLAYTVELAGREVVTGVGSDLPVIAAYGEGTFKVTAAVSLMEGFRLMSDLMAQPSDRIPYKLTTKLDVGTFMPAIRVMDEGELTFAPPR